MDNQHKLIKGYRDLSQGEIDLMNEIKAKGVEIQALCAKVEAHVSAQYAHANPAPGVMNDQEAFDRLIAANPQHWCQWAKDGMQANLMYLTRSVAQPTSF